MGKTCINCGAELPEEASFCPHCAQSQIEKTKTAPPRLWRKKTFIAGLGVVVLAVVIFACFYAKRPKICEGGASVVYPDKDGEYELLVNFFPDDIANNKQAGRKKNSLPVDK